MDSVAGKQMDTFFYSVAGPEIDIVALNHAVHMDKVAGQQMNTFLDSVAGQEIDIVA